MLVIAGCVGQGVAATDAGEDAGTTAPGATGEVATGTTAEPSTTSEVVSGTTTEPTTTEPATTTGEGTGASTGTTDASSSGGEATTTGDTTGAEALGFEVHVWPIVAARCGCHLDGNGAGKLKLTKSVAYTNLVGRPSKQAPLALVEPGSAELSYAWHKINDTQDDVGGSGKRMPPGGLIPVDELDVFTQWIDEGAAP